MPEDLIVVVSRVVQKIEYIRLKQTEAGHRQRHQTLQRLTLQSCPIDTKHIKKINRKHNGKKPNFNQRKELQKKDFTKS